MMPKMVQTVTLRRPFHTRLPMDIEFEGAESTGGGVGTPSTVSVTSVLAAVCVPFSITRDGADGFPSSPGAPAAEAATSALVVMVVLETLLFPVGVSKGGSADAIIAGTRNRTALD